MKMGNCTAGGEYTMIKRVELFRKYLISMELNKA
ncbi:hypothetical protein T36_2017 [Helicobacter cinaedi]|nr:hypothetical protein T36_2017 [Helicobacter cinaedi]